MDRQYPSSSRSSNPPKSLLRSSVSMFIEDSRITAVANAEPPPPLPPTSTAGPAGHRRPSYFSVTSYTSSSSTSGGVGGGGVSPSQPSTSSFLRPTFCQISATLPNQMPGRAPSAPPRPRACSSSPVRYPSTGREFIHSIIREDEEETSTYLSSSSGGRGRKQSHPPPSTVRRRSTLSVEPSMSFLSVKEALPTVQEDRAYTSVNLTLRAPSIGGGVGGTVINTGGGLNVVNTVNVKLEDGGTTSFRHVHRHPVGGDEEEELEGAVGGAEGGAVGGGGGGANLMYSSYSNSRDGFEAQVQIQFGPNGGTFTASRRRSSGYHLRSHSQDDKRREEHHLHQHNISIRQQMSTDLLSAQTERKDKLRAVIQDRRIILAKLQTEIGHLRSQLELQGSFSELERLKQENRTLRIECNFMSKEVDLYQNGNVPLGETNEEFYQGINPGQSLTALFGLTNNRRKIGGPGGQPPPRPPPPKFLNREQGYGGSLGNTPTTPTRDFGGGVGGGGGRLGGGDVGGKEEGFGGGVGDESGGEWTCSMCTFQNHRDLDFCEACRMVRVKSPQHQQPPHHQFHHHHSHHHGPSREQNIRIRVRRHRRPNNGNNRDNVRGGGGIGGGGMSEGGDDGLNEDEDDIEEERERRRRRLQQRRVIHSWVL